MGKKMGERLGGGDRDGYHRKELTEIFFFSNREVAQFLTALVCEGTRPPTPEKTAGEGRVFTPPREKESWE